MTFAPAVVSMLALTGLVSLVAPSAASQKPRAAAQPTAVLTITVTDTSGAALSDVTVSATGPLVREGITTAAGQVRLLGIRPGTYRVRFEREGFNTFEKEVTWRAGTPAPTAEAALTPAPPPPEAPPAAAAPPTPATPSYVPDLPPGKASTTSLLDYIERNFIATREPQKESLIGCSASAQSWLWQIREPWQNRVHDTAEAMVYVVGGDGTLTLDGRDIQVEAGSFAVIPRTTQYGFTRRGRNPLIILATLSGPPCAQ